MFRLLWQSELQLQNLKYSMPRIGLLLFSAFSGVSTCSYGYQTVDSLVFRNTGKKRSVSYSSRNTIMLCSFLLF
jgi:hypothetical protein